MLWSGALTRQEMRGTPDEKMAHSVCPLAQAGAGTSCSEGGGTGAAGPLVPPLATCGLSLWDQWDMHSLQREPLPGKAGLSSYPLLPWNWKAYLQQRHT